MNDLPDSYWFDHRQLADPANQGDVRVVEKSIEIGIVFFSGMTQLDVTGPFEVLARLPNARMHLLWKQIEPVLSDVGLLLSPTTTFDDSPVLDVLCIGGGPGRNVVMEDPETLASIARLGASARYVTSVCSGALILGAAGLLNGYRSTCHWMSRDQLSFLGAIPLDARVVIDRNRISGGGVTAGIDFGFQLAAELCGDDVARRLQLLLEYDPKPPFDVTVHNASPALLAKVRASGASWAEEGRRVSERAGARLAEKARAVEAA